MKILAQFILLCTLCGCKNYSPAAGNLQIDLREIQTVSFNTYFDKVSIQELETSDSSLIQSDDKLIVHDDILYVLDRKQNAILLFYLNGEFIRKIRNIGQGPGEYIILHDMCINRFKNELNLLTVNTSKIIIHDLQGNFLYEHHLPDELKAPRYFEAVGMDKYLIYSPYSESQLRLYSLKREEVQQLFLGPIDQDLYHNTSLKVARSPFYFTGDSLKYFQAFTNDIYAFDKDKMIHSFSWDFGDYNFDYTSDLPDDKSKYMDFIRRNSDKFVFLFLNNLENSKIRYSFFVFDNKTFNLIYQKNTKNYDLFTRFTEGYLPIKNTILDEGAMYALISPLNFEIFDNSDFYYQNDLDKIDVTANPVLFQFQLKKEFY